MHPPARQRPRVLVVDDERSLQFTLSSILRELDRYLVDTAGDFSQAHALMHKRHYDAVVTDWNLGPRGSGIEVAAQAKQLDPCPVVVMYTGYPNLDMMQQALRARSDYLDETPTDIE